MEKNAVPRATEACRPCANEGKRDVNDIASGLHPHKRCGHVDVDAKRDVYRNATRATAWRPRRVGRDWGGKRGRPEPLAAQVLSTSVDYE